MLKALKTMVMHILQRSRGLEISITLKVRVRVLCVQCEVFLYVCVFAHMFSCVYIFV